jgi:hypothetical protein
MASLNDFGNLGILFVSLLKVDIALTLGRLKGICSFMMLLTDSRSYGSTSDTG